MALEVTKLKRVFKIDKNGKLIVLNDPNPEMTTGEVIKFYSGEHPELTNAVMEGPTVVKDQATYVMTTKAGKLG